MANVCDRCGYAHGVKKVMLMVEGRAGSEHKLCADHRNAVIDAVRLLSLPALQARVKV